MYVPEHFCEHDSERVLQLIAAHPFGMLVTHADGPFVSHLPFLLDRDADSKPRLLAHLARANPQWRHLEGGGDVLAVFQGPHAYVSPNWYGSPGVPTWNYAVAQVRGAPRLVQDDAEVENFLERLTRVHEAAMPDPWQPMLAGERKARLFGMIGVFEIEIADIQGKFKLSQNRPADDRERIADALARSGGNEAAVARLMRDPA